MSTPTLRSRRSLRAACALALGLLLPVAASAAVPTGFVDELVASLGSPTGLAFTPDGRLLISTQGGRLRVYSSGTLLASPALDLSGVLCSNSERGLLSVAVDPEFETNQFIYVYYTFRKPAGASCPTSSSNVVNRVSRFVLPASSLVDPASETVLVDNIHSWAGNHNAGDVHFGKDGFLYVSVGDSGADYAGDSGSAGANDAARDTHVLLGKILRITRDGAIPASNPWQGTGTARCNVTGSTTPGNRCQETFAWGLRNPFRIAFDPGSVATRFFINDVGQNSWEEIDEGVVGADYGWNCREGAHTNSSSGRCAAGVPPGPFREPIHEYDRSTGCASITGGAFVPRGSWPVAFDGDYLFADYVCGQIFRLEPSGSSYTRSSFATGLGGSSAVDMLFGSDGLYYTTYASGGQVRRIRYTGSENRAPVARVTATPPSGPAPLSVLFNGSESSDPDPGDVVTTFVWDFGDGTAVATTSTATTTHVYAAAGTYTAVLRVRDTSNTVSDPALIVINAGNSAPQATILTPTALDRFAVGQTVTLEGQATDAEDGTLPAASLSWTVLLHHAAHTHPFFGPASGNRINITYPAPEDLAAAANSYLEVRLTATDRLGATTTVTRDALPRTVNLTFATQPAGLQVTVNSAPLATPQTFVSWVGNGVNVDVPAQAGFAFTSWSDGGARAHAIVSPTTPTTYTATLSPSVSLSINDVSVSEGNAGTTTAAFTVTLSGPSSQTVSASYATANGSATAGSDYAAGSGTLTFPPGTTSQPVSVVVTGDTVVEGDETFFVNLSGASNATISDAQGLGTILNDDSLPPPPGSEPVVWTSGVGVMVDGNSLTKTTAAPTDGGAASVQRINSGDGFVEFRASETSTYRMVGLSNGNTDASYPDIDFGLDLAPGGVVYVFEGGMNRGTFGNYQTGDVFRVAVTGGTVRYSRNGVVLYTSTQVPIYPLLVDAWLYNQGATITNALVGGVGGAPPTPPPPPPGSEAVVWTSPVGVAVDGNSLTKTSATGTNAGAVSVQQINAGDGFVEFRAAETSTYRMVGLSNGNADASYPDIDFGLDLASGAAVYVFERGVNRGTFGAYQAGDVFRVSVTSGTVRYSRNGAVFYTSTQVPVYPLLVDTWLYNLGATILNAFVGGTGGAPPTPPPPPPGSEPVVWTSGVGVMVDGNSLTKTTAAPTDGGAASVQRINSGDGFVEFRASETSTYRMVGLSNGNTDASYPDIDFGLDLAPGGVVYVFEGGMNRGTFGNYQTGDVFRVAVTGGTVRYSRNGAVLYTSTQVPIYPLLVDAWLYNQGATITNALVGGVGGAPPTPPPPPAGSEAVVWTSPVGVAVDGNSLTKTAATGTNAGAVSVQQINAGDGFVEFRAAETSTYRMVGLSNGNTDASYPDIDFGLDLASGAAVYVFERGVNRGTFGAYQAGDVFRVSVTSGTVRYSRNGAVFYTSTQVPVYPLLVDTWLYNLGATILNAFVGGS